MILITGASGFLGRRLVQRALDHGHQVRALVRRPAQDLDIPPNLLYQGDITDPSTLTGAMVGIKAVIHAAATTSEMAPDEALSRRTNVEGNLNLISACKKAGI